MADSLVKQLLEAGVHFGHRASGWNPKMKPYIFGKKNGIHIIDVRETVKGLLLAKRFLTRVVAGGKDVLFVGTKRQAAPILESKVGEVGMPWVTERWLGGTLTNFRTIRGRLKRLEELEQLMESEDWSHYSKKMASQLTRERKKIHRNLSGVRTMEKLPGAMVVIDVGREGNALREAQTLGVPTVCIIDTDSDPDMADIPIPANDDAMRAVELIIAQLCEAVKEGKTARAQAALEKKPAAEGDTSQRRRSSRAMFKAEDEVAEDQPQVEQTRSKSSVAPEPEGQAAADQPAEGESTRDTGEGAETSKEEPAASNK